MRELMGLFVYSKITRILKEGIDVMRIDDPDLRQQPLMCRQLRAFIYQR